MDIKHHAEVSVPSLKRAESAKEINLSIQSGQASFSTKSFGSLLDMTTAKLPVSNSSYDVPQPDQGSGSRKGVEPKTDYSSHRTNQEDQSEPKEHHAKSDTHESVQGQSSASESKRFSESQPEEDNTNTQSDSVNFKEKAEAEAITELTDSGADEESMLHTEVSDHNITLSAESQSLETGQAIEEIEKINVTENAPLKADSKEDPLSGHSPHFGYSRLKEAVVSPSLDTTSQSDIKIDPKNLEQHASKRHLDNSNQLNVSLSQIRGEQANSPIEKEVLALSNEGEGDVMTKKSMLDSQLASVTKVNANNQDDLKKITTHAKSDLLGLAGVQPTSVSTTGTANNMQRLSTYSLTYDKPFEKGSTWSRGLFDRVVWMVQNKIQRAQIQIEPQDLGPMKIEVKIHKEQATLTFTSHSGQVREVLENNINRIRDMMQEEGYSEVQAEVKEEKDQQQSYLANGSNEGHKDEMPMDKESDTTDSDAMIGTEASISLVNYYI